MKRCLNLTLFLIIVLSTNLFGQSISIKVDHPDHSAWVSGYFENTETSENFSFDHSAVYIFDHDGFEVELPSGDYFYHVNYHSPHSCNGIRIFDGNSEINSKDDCGDINLNGEVTIGVLGCKDPLAANYNSEATLDDESCVICTPGSYGEDGVCVACPEGTFSSSSGASVCTYTSICADDEYETLAPTTTSNRVCSALSTCTAEEYESVAPTATSNRVCSALSTCTAEEYESVAPTATSNRVCSTLSQCSSDEFEALAPSLTSDRECSALSLCSANEFVLVAATSTSDRICETIIEGCTDATAYNFDNSANTDDGSCENLSLPEGWSMFGYTCIESQDVIASFEGHEGQIEIVKDESGLAYLPVYNFNAIGNLRYGEGYQIKLKEKLEGFKFCEPVGQADVDAAVNAVDITTDNQAAFDEGVASVTPEDGITQVDLDSVISSYEGYTPPLDLKIGDLHAGGIVFQINENGSGLVVSSGDLGSRNWRDALLLASSYSSEGYTGWHLPSFEELKLICSTVGPGTNVNHAGLIYDHYWSSTEYSNNEAAVVFPSSGPGSSYVTYNLNKVFSFRVRAIRSF